MLSYSPLFVAAVALGLLGPAATAEPYRLFRSSNIYVDGVGQSNDEASSNDSRSTDKAPQTLTSPRQNLGFLSYTVNDRNGILGMLPEQDDFSMPSALPSNGPSLFPSLVPTHVHSLNSKVVSTVPSLSLVPTKKDSLDPSSFPSISTTPTFDPSTPPSHIPSVNPSLAPSSRPSTNPSSAPTENTSKGPTIVPTESMSEDPTFVRTQNPSEDPTNVGTESPSEDPTFELSEFSFENSTVSPYPSFSPSFTPTISNITDDDFADDDFFEDSSTLTQFPSSNMTSAPSAEPTIEDCKISEDERTEQIFELLDKAGDPIKNRDLNTPQGLAADWLIHQDFRKECPSQKIVQRWVIAAFYFSTNGEFWEKCSAAGSDPCGSEF
eukprot:CAMPEP_0116131336 /NCGR_PEP_ID=MMETSP0329-20121206/8951_1 /TAXON_ID=697910 /ORGANISM="Pseudo-nitzschia arenysensis, Strain B593" /LENGTH=379 /DNA_ID=CAMNT_0003625759 /DNA_START=3232 /DNA_END=4369 /DNA_ORIENTATION=-